MTRRSSVNVDVQDPKTEALERVVSLFGRRQLACSPYDLHLDIGAPLQAHADAIQRAIGGTYVGISLDVAHQLQIVGDRRELYYIDSNEKFAEQLDRIIGHRNVTSIILLGQVECLSNIDEIFRTLADLANAKRAYVAISASNGAHLDAGASLVFGRTERNVQIGRITTMTRPIDSERLTHLLGDAGLYPIDCNDVVPEGDQFQHPLLRPASSLGGLLADSAGRANPATAVRQFVWLCIAGPKRRELAPQNRTAVKRPFLTIVIRTQGRRLHTLNEALVCLSGQTNDDFEMLIVAHKLDAPSLAAVLRMIDDMAENMRCKIRLLPVAAGGRARPLNVGFEHARGEYIAILDDDDIPMAHWVAEFSNLARNYHGRVLRTVCVRQDSVNVDISGKRGLRATGGLERAFPSTYSFLDHLFDNFSPPICLAFPREAFHHLGLRFDERLSTCEDWDFLVQAAALCGVADLPEITGIYRWWTQNESSRTIHPDQQWVKNSNMIRSKLENTWIILPKGESSRLSGLVEASYQLRVVERERDETEKRLRAAEGQRDDAEKRRRGVEADRDDAAKRAHIVLRFAKATRRHVKRRIIMLRWRRALSFWSKYRRKRYGAKIEECKEYLRQV